jgi:hypothetical protein
MLEFNNIFFLVIVNKRIDTLQERSNKKMDILEENNINYLTSKISKIIDRLAVPINDEMPVLAGFEQIIRAFSFSSDMKSCSLVGASSSKNGNNLKPNPSMATLMDLNTLHHVSPKVIFIFKVEFNSVDIYILFTFRRRFTTILIQ